MPDSTTTCATILAGCQSRVRDVTTKIWDATTFAASDWANAINLAQQEILNDIIRDKAWDLCDMLFDSTPITMVVDTEDYDWGAAISGAAKTYYAFVNATWGDYPVIKLPRYRYSDLVVGRIYPSVNRPYMVFWGDEYFKLRPKPTETATVFTFHFIKLLTVLDATTEKPQIDERCIPLFYPKVAAKYWQRRGRYELVMMEDNEDPRNPGNYQKLRNRLFKQYKHYELKDLTAVE